MNYENSCFNLLSKLLNFATTLPAEEGLSEVVLGSVLRLHSSLQQHLLVELPLLLLLLQMLLHAETLPVILLYVLCGVMPLDKQTHAHKAILKQYSDMICFTLQPELLLI